VIEALDNNTIVGVREEPRLTEQVGSMAAMDARRLT
jgi:hypothetical protein